MDKRERGMREGEGKGEQRVRDGKDILRVRLRKDRKTKIVNKKTEQDRNEHGHSFKRSKYCLSKRYDSASFLPRSFLLINAIP